MRGHTQLKYSFELECRSVLVCGAAIKIRSAGELVNNNNLVFSSAGCEVHDQGANRLVSCDACVLTDGSFCGTTWKGLWVSLRPRFYKGTNVTPWSFAPSSTHLPVSGEGLWVRAFQRRSYSDPRAWPCHAEFRICSHILDGLPSLAESILNILVF